MGICVFVYTSAREWTPKYSTSETQEGLTYHQTQKHELPWPFNSECVRSDTLMEVVTMAINRCTI